MRLDNEHFHALVAYLKNEEILDLGNSSQQSLLDEIISNIPTHNILSKIVYLFSISEEKLPLLFPIPLPFQKEYDAYVDTMHILSRKCHNLRRKLSKIRNPKKIKNIKTILKKSMNEF